MSTRATWSRVVQSRDFSVPAGGAACRHTAAPKQPHKTYVPVVHTAENKTQRPIYIYICTGFTTCICPAFYAAILLINILLLLLLRNMNRQRHAHCAHKSYSKNMFIFLLSLKLFSAFKGSTRAPQRPLKYTPDDI